MDWNNKYLLEFILSNKNFSATLKEHQSLRQESEKMAKALGLSESAAIRYGRAMERALSNVKALSAEANRNMVARGASPADIERGMPEISKQYAFRNQTRLNRAMFNTYGVGSSNPDPRILSMSEKELKDQVKRPSDAQLGGFMVTRAESDYRKYYTDIGKAHDAAIKEDYRRTANAGKAQRQLANMQMSAQKMNQPTFYGGLNAQKAGQLEATAEKEMRNEFAKRIRTQRNAERAVAKAPQGKGGFLGKEIGKLNIAGLAIRAAATIPVWFAIRAAMSAVTNTIKDGIQTYIMLEDAMADVKTMLETTGSAADKEMKVAGDAIKNMASQSRVPLEEVAKAFRFLKSANLDFQATMGAFPVVVELMSAFGLKAQEASRLLAGVYNTAKDKLGNVKDAGEAFRKFGDILAYTYVKQDVLVGELAASYAKFAPYIKDSNLDMNQLITTIGYLNTLMLRSGRTGTSFGRMLQAMGKNADKLADAFGVTIDPNKALQPLEIFRAMNKQLKNEGDYTQKQMALIFDIFEIRAGIPVKLIAANLQSLEAAIKDSAENAEGYLKKINDIKMDTFAGQFQRVTTNFKLFTSEIIGSKQWKTWAKDFADSIDTVEKRSEGLKTVGLSGGGFILSSIFKGLDSGVKSHSIGPKFLQGFASLIGSPLGLDKVMNSYLDSLQRKIDSKRKSGDITNRELTEEEKIVEIRALNLELEEKTQNRREMRVAFAAHELNLAKLQGKNEIEIARLKLEQLVTGRAAVESKKEEVEIYKAELSLAEKIKGANMRDRSKVGQTAEDLYFEKDPLKASRMKEALAMSKMSSQSDDGELRKAIKYDTGGIRELYKEFSGLFSSEQKKMIQEEFAKIMGFDLNEMSEPLSAETKAQIEALNLNTTAVRDLYELFGGKSGFWMNSRDKIDESRRIIDEMIAEYKGTTTEDTNIIRGNVDKFLPKVPDVAEYKDDVVRAIGKDGKLWKGSDLPSYAKAGPKENAWRGGEIKITVGDMSFQLPEKFDRETLKKNLADAVFTNEFLEQLDKKLGIGNRS